MFASSLWFIFFCSCRLPQDIDNCKGSAADCHTPFDFAHAIHSELLACFPPSPLANPGYCRHLPNACCALYWVLGNTLRLRLGSIVSGTAWITVIWYFHIQLRVHCYASDCLLVPWWHCTRPSCLWHYYGRYQRWIWQHHPVRWALSANALCS